MTAIHTHVSTEHLPTWSILTAAGHATGPEISASRWLNCARAILHCWRPTCTASDVETQPLVHIAMVLTRRQNIWCYTAQHTTRRGGSHGQISTTKATQDAYGASWRGSGRWPVPDREWEREWEREYIDSVVELSGYEVTYVCCIIVYWQLWVTRWEAKCLLLDMSGVYLSPVCSLGRNGMLAVFFVLTLLYHNYSKVE